MNVHFYLVLSRETHPKVIYSFYSKIGDLHYININGKRHLTLYRNFSTMKYYGYKRIRKNCFTYDGMSFTRTKIKLGPYSFIQKSLYLFAEEKFLIKNRINCLEISE